MHRNTRHSEEMEEIFVLFSIINVSLALTLSLLVYSFSMPWICTLTQVCKSIENTYRFVLQISPHLSTFLGNVSNSNTRVFWLDLVSVWIQVQHECCWRPFWFIFILLFLCLLFSRLLRLESKILQWCVNK